jgi:mycoredoxin-dependent peroxiredoxin
MRHLTFFLVLLSGMLLDVRSAAALEVGDKAPDFTLPSTTGEAISLHQFLGKKHLLIEFYVRAFGPTWIKNLSARGANYHKLQELDIQVLAISADETFAQTTFALSLKSPFPFLSDHPELQVIRSYAGLQPHPSDPTRQVARRALFLIDKQGIVRGKWQGETQDMLPADEVMKVAQDIAGAS